MSLEDADSAFSTFCFAIVGGCPTAISARDQWHLGVFRGWSTGCKPQRLQNLLLALENNIRRVESFLENADEGALKAVVGIGK